MSYVCRLIFVTLTYCAITAGITQAQSDSIFLKQEWLIQPLPNLNGSIESPSGKYLFAPGYGTLAIVDAEEVSVVRSIPWKGASKILRGPDDSSLFALRALTQGHIEYHPRLDTASHFDTEVVVPGATLLLHVNLVTGSERIVDTLVDCSWRSTMSSDGHHLYFSDGIHYLKIRDATTGRLLKSIGSPPVRLTYNQGIIDRIAGPFNKIVGHYLSGDKKYIVVIDEDSLAVFDLLHRRELWQTGGSWRAQATATILTPDNRILIASGDDTLYSLNLNTGHRTATYYDKFPQVALFLSSDTLIGQRSWRRRKSVHTSGDTLGVYDLKRHTFSPLGELSAAPRLGEEISKLIGRSILLQKDYSPFEVIHLRTGIRDTVNLLGGSIQSIGLSPNSLVAQVWNTGYKIIDTRSRNILHEWSCPIAWPVSISPDAQWATVGQNNGTTILWDLTEKQTHLTLDTRYYPRCVAFSPDSKRMAIPLVSRSSVMAEIYDVQTGELTDSVGPLPPRDGMNVIFSHDGKELISSGSDSIHFWDVKTRRIHGDLVCGNEPVGRIILSKDGEWLIAQEYSGKVYVWNLRDSALRATFSAPPRYSSVCLSPNDRYLLFSDGSSLRSQDLRSGMSPAKVILTFPVKISSFGFSSDGASFAVGGDNGALGLYETPATWLSPEHQPILLNGCIWPLRFYVPSSARPALDNGKPYSPPRTDVILQLLDADKHVVADLVKGGPLHTGKWHVWEYDASALPVGTYYKRTVIGGVEEIARLSRK